MKKYYKFTALILSIILLLSLTACASEESRKDSRQTTESTKRTATDGKKSQSVKKDNLKLLASKELPTGSSGTEPVTSDVDDTFQKAYKDYAFRLFSENYKVAGCTNMISPFSLFMALGMLTNGASGETKDELEALFGMPIEDINRYAASWSRQLTGSEEIFFTNANSIWLRNSFADCVEENFLRNCADYYQASVLVSDFNDSKAVDDINKWVNYNTDGMIQKMYDNIDPMTVSILLNAISFDGDWQIPFEDGNVSDKSFTHENGTKETKSMMEGEADSVFYENELCTGCKKDYKGGVYSFLALLPKEGVSISELINSLTGDSFFELTNNGRYGAVTIEIPEFTESFTADMNELLHNMGVNRAFLPGGADFSALSKEESLYVSSVLQKTYIEVNPKGTRAAAVTGIIADTEAFYEPENFWVVLDHSFVYMIVDNNGNMPVFMGVYQ